MIALITLIVAYQTSTPSPPPALTATPSAIASPVEDPSITKLARQQFNSIVAGKIDKTQYSIAIPASALSRAQAGLAKFGPVQKVEFLKSLLLAQGTVYVYRFTCQKGAVIEQISLKGGKINGIYFAPAQ